MMKREDIEHLASLARIRLTDEELSKLETELSSIVEYVGVVSDIAASDADATPQVGVRHNIFRDDEATNQPEQFTKDIMAEMPKTDGRFLSVKKILQTDE